MIDRTQRSVVQNGGRSALRFAVKLLVGISNGCIRSHPIELEQIVHRALIVRLAIHVEGGDVTAGRSKVEPAVGQAECVADLMEERAGNYVGALAHVLVRCRLPKRQSDG